MATAPDTCPLCSTRLDPALGDLTHPGCAPTAGTTSDGDAFEALVARLQVIDDTPSGPVDLGASALFYAQRLDWPVFPLRPSGKAPLTPHGYLDASRDPDTIEAWWTRWPTANIGTPTGLREQGGCGYDVIDVDGPDGFTSIADLRHADCPPGCCKTSMCPATGSLPDILARALTPGDPGGTRCRPPGMHLYSHAAGTSCTTRAMAGIDLRGDGGYVVIPPSIGPSGARYTWATRPRRLA